MLLKTGASVAVLTLLLGATAGSAQTTVPQQRPTTTAPSSEAPKAPVAGQIVVQEANTILAKDLIGQTVLAPDKAKIGSISDLILSKDGKTVEGFVIGVGGFLGIGAKDVALAPAAFQVEMDRDTAKLKLAMTRDELKNAPEFKALSRQPAPTTGQAPRDRGPVTPPK